MLAAAARRLLHQGLRPGERAVVVTTGSEGYALAAELSHAGVHVAAVADARPAGDGSTELGELLRQRQVTLLPGHGIVRAREGSGCAAWCSRSTGQARPSENWRSTAISSSSPA
jgi:sarcosine oxidase subunit alpha